MEWQCSEKNNYENFGLWNPHNKTWNILFIIWTWNAHYGAIDQNIMVLPQLPINSRDTLLVGTIISNTLTVSITFGNYYDLVKMSLN